ncbi:hypothetical protein [Streptomyces sp. NRRL S-350]|uniref:hypothetical protein n=1 Tax=Streptomyces sp. NRRL S-350 TaxID=1463902 RepID=UPI00131B60A8|nr:hypothetical protein [Streptomyces sp. NRRL S-350]
MSVPEESDRPQVDEETLERSSEQRNITAPTPPDVRAEGEDEDEADDRPEPPAADSQAP